MSPLIVILGLPPDKIVPHEENKVVAAARTIVVFFRFFFIVLWFLFVPIVSSDSAVINVENDLIIRTYTKK